MLNTTPAIRPAAAIAFAILLTPAIAAAGLLTPTSRQSDISASNHTGTLSDPHGTTTTVSDSTSTFFLFDSSRGSGATSAQQRSELASDGVTASLTSNSGDAFGTFSWTSSSSRFSLTFTAPACKYTLSGLIDFTSIVPPDQRFSSSATVRLTGPDASVNLTTRNDVPYNYFGTLGGGNYTLLLEIHTGSEANTGSIGTMTGNLALTPGPVPEPATLAILALAALPLMGRRSPLHPRRRA